jgi:hypothetical protein
MNYEPDKKKRFKSLNTTGDLDLEPARLEHRFCTSFLWGEHFTKVS